MGFVPTTDNNLRRIVDEWLRDQTIWQLRARTGADESAHAERDTIGAQRAPLRLQPPVEIGFNIRVSFPLQHVYCLQGILQPFLVISQGNIKHIQRHERLNLIQRRH